MNNMNGRTFGSNNVQGFSSNGTYALNKKVNRIPAQRWKGIELQVSSMNRVDSTQK